MQNCLRITGLTILLLAGLTGRGWAQPSSDKYLPPGSGVIDGKAAITVVPAVYDGRMLADYLDSAGLEVHLALTDESGVELAYSAGAWVQPPPGRYRMWLQGGWRMTPFSRVISWGAPVAKAGMVSDAVLGPAGRVKLPPGLQISPDLDLHLLHAGIYLEGEFARWEISPRKPISEVGDGVLMPVGKTVGALWNRKTRQYVAVSRPFEVRERTTVEIPLEGPGDGAALVAHVARRKLALRAEDMEVKLFVQQQGAQRPADLAVFTTDRVYGFWYGLSPGPAELMGEDQEDVVPGQRLELQSGKIERVTAEMKARPALDVQLDVPSALLHEKPVLEIRRLPLGEVLEHRELKPNAGTLRFERLPAALLQVELQTTIGAFSQQADLSSGEDGFLLLKPAMITLTGRVFYGDEGHAAQLTFANAAREIKVTSEDDGRYEAVFLEPVQTVSIRLDGVERDPYFDFFRPAIAASKEVDFHLPDGDFRVRVLDASTGKGIVNAMVEIRNNYVPKEGSEGSAETKRPGTRRDRAVFQTVKTGESGEAQLPPLRPGSLEIRASAAGYARMREAVKAEILDENADQMFELRLDPIGATEPVRLRLPNGTPASGAQILLMRSLEAAEELFSGQADGEGVVQLPRKLSGVLLIKHPAAAVSVRDWQPQPEEAEEIQADWALPAPADRPLTVQVKDSSGTQGVGRADLALWIQGRRLSGLSLVWLTGRPPATDPNGFWTVNNLPRTNVSVLAWGPESRAGSAAGTALDSRATVIAYPWPAPVEVRVVE